jgi:hypothetical protein
MNQKTITPLCILLITMKGFMVKVAVPTEDGKKKIIYFFVDNDFEHKPWILTINQGIVPNHLEYNRLKCRYHLQEMNASTLQLSKALEIAKEVMADPYYGLEEHVKAAYQHTVNGASSVLPEESQPEPVQEIISKPVGKKEKKKINKSITSPMLGFKFTDFDGLSRILASA